MRTNIASAVSHRIMYNPMKRLLFVGLAIFVAIPSSAQLYTGLSGLINTPSADMNEVGTARIGTYFMNKHFTPDAIGIYGFHYEGEKYNTMDFYASIVPFSWVEIAYTFTLMKCKEEGYDKASYCEKDRYFSVKLRPLKEGKYWPPSCWAATMSSVLPPVGRTMTSARGISAITTSLPPSISCPVATTSV